MSSSRSRRARTVLASAAVLCAFTVAAPVADAGSAKSAVYVLSNQTSGNRVLVFARNSDGSSRVAGRTSAWVSATSAGMPTASG